MFDEQTGRDWLLIETACAFGFGVIHHRIGAVEDPSTGLVEKPAAPPAHDPTAPDRRR